MQAWPPPHALPHAPQCRGSLERSAQLVPHITVPTAQMHVPPLQVEPVPQRWPQVPQLFASVCVFTQLPPQANSPVGHVHTPDTQVAPEGHT